MGKAARNRAIRGQAAKIKQDVATTRTQNSIARSLRRTGAVGPGESSRGKFQPAYTPKIQKFPAIKKIVRRGDA